MVPPVAAEIVVLTATNEAVIIQSFTQVPEALLNPYHPNQRMKVPSKEKPMLLGSLRKSLPLLVKRLRRGPTFQAANKAAPPPVTCTTLDPA